MPVDPDHRHAPFSRMPEWQIAAPILHHIRPILLVSALGAGAAFLLAEARPAPHPAKAELLMRVGYEYTPAPADPTRDYQQVTVRLDEAIGTELQILASLPLIARTLKDEPHPHGPAVADLTAQDVLELLDVKRIEGSTIVALELLDERSDWAARFLDRLIANYRQERSRLYGQDAYTEMLTAQRTEAAGALEAGRSELAGVTLAMVQQTAKLREGISVLASDPARQAEYRDVRAALAALQLRLADRQSTQGVVALLDRIGSEESSGLALTSPVPPGSVVAMVDDLGRMADRISALNTIEAEVGTRVAALDDALMRQQVRELGSANVEVMTPPYVSDQAAGLSSFAKSVLGGIMVFLAASAIAVVHAGLRRPEDDEDGASSLAATEEGHSGGSTGA
jgi:hypothetical protein